MSLRGKLQRYKKDLTIQSKQDSTEHIERLTRNTAVENRTKEQQAENQELEESIPYWEEWQKLHSSACFHESEYILRREIEYPLSYKHGKYSFAQLMDVIQRWKESKVNHPLSAHSYSSHDLLFFDTETTGLGGGVGNTIFLLGYGQIEKTGFSVTQLFLPSPAAEFAFYSHFLADIKEKKLLVSYNGKAFDWPQVKTRHTLLRDELQELPAVGHYDLLHAARRLWKDQLPSCRLSVVEEQVMGYHRYEDTPGYMAPVHYFQFLQSKDPADISGVLTHNEWDICSLVSLYIHISMMLLEEVVESSLCNARELIEIGRWFETVGEIGSAIANYKKAIRIGGRDEIQAKQLLASLYKKKKEYHLAQKLWEEISGHGYFPLETNIELAKLYEHVYKDYSKALYYAEKAYHSWSGVRTRGSRSTQAKMKDELQTRIKRLEKKVESQEMETEYNLFSGA